MTPAVERVLDLARWAPSGDNTQPWRFEVAGERHVVVHGHDTRDHCVYDLQGRASQLSLGALIETMAIAATQEGWRTRVQHRADSPPTHPVFDVRFEPSPGLAADPLVAVIRQRSVQRRPLSTQPLSAAQKAALEAAAGPAYRVLWRDSASQRWAVARLLFRSAHIRLTTPEAYQVHRDIIEWHARESLDRVPDQALGADALTLTLMRFGLQSWSRVRFFNRYLAGTWPPRLQLDLLPGLACAAHYVLAAERPPRTLDDQVAAGRAVQRLWLTATTLGLQQQPEMTPLIFAEYARTGTVFTREPGKLQRAAAVGASLAAVFDADPQHFVWMARLGSGPAPTARSLRLPLAQLLRPGQPG